MKILTAQHFSYLLCAPFHFLTTVFGVKMSLHCKIIVQPKIKVNMEPLPSCFPKMLTAPHFLNKDVGPFVHSQEIMDSEGVRPTVSHDYNGIVFCINIRDEKVNGVRCD